MCFFAYGNDVGVARLERATTCSQSRYANQLRYTPEIKKCKRRAKIDYFGTNEKRIWQQIGIIVSCIKGSAKG